MRKDNIDKFLLNAILGIVKEDDDTDTKLIRILLIMESRITQMLGKADTDLTDFITDVREDIRPRIVEAVKTCRCKEPEKDRYLTNKELAMWLAQGNGLATEKSTGRKAASYCYREDDNERVDYINMAVCKWNDKEWHEPTYNYCFGEE